MSCCVTKPSSSRQAEGDARRLVPVTCPVWFVRLGLSCQETSGVSGSTALPSRRHQDRTFPTFLLGQDRALRLRLVKRCRCFLLPEQPGSEIWAWHLLLSRWGLHRPSEVFLCLKGAGVVQQRLKVGAPVLLVCSLSLSASP